MEVLNSVNNNKELSELNLPKTLEIYSNFRIHEDWSLLVLDELLLTHLLKLYLEDLLILVSPLCRLQRDLSILQKQLPVLLNAIEVRSRTGKICIKEWDLWIRLLKCMQSAKVSDSKVLKLALDQLTPHLHLMSGEAVASIMSVCKEINCTHSNFFKQVIHMVPIIYTSEEELETIVTSIPEGIEGREWLGNFFKFRSATLV